MNYQEINKKNISKWEDALRYLTEILNSNNVKYYISASGLHYILGSDIYPHDIDLFMSRDDVKKVFEILKEYKISKLHYCEEDGREYLEFQGEYNGIPFEICEWNKEPNNIEIFDFKGMKISLDK
jgi:hypothetical protein